MDTREDKGEFYPGGGRAGVTPERPYMGKVDCVNLSEIGESYTLKAVKDKLNQVVRAMAPAAICVVVSALASFAVGDVMPHYAPLEEIPANTPLMTNVQTYVDAKVAESGPGNYNVVSNAAMSAVTTNKQGNATISGKLTVQTYDGIRVHWFPGDDYWLDMGTDVSWYSESGMWGFADNHGEVWTLPHGGGVLATTRETAAAANAAKNYTDEAIANLEIPDPDLSEYAKLYAVSALANFATNTDVKASTAIAYLQGDDAKVVITNYDSSVQMPSMSFQQRVEEGGSNVWNVVWNELTRWNWLTGTYLPAHFYGKTQIDALLDGKADRAWGFYDSHTGNYAPDGYTWVSSPKIAIAAGLAYQRTVTSGGEIWVLESNGLVTETGGTVSNGFFRISDDENNALFEIVKGNKRTIGAQAEQPAITNVMGIAHMYIKYNVVSESFPKLKICTDLSAANWQDEDSADGAANVDWHGTSGAYVAEVWGKTAQPRMFVKAEYEVGGETYIKNAAPISVQGGILCTDGIHKVRPVWHSGNTVTWEVVP